MIQKGWEGFIQIVNTGQDEKATHGKCCNPNCGITFSFEGRECILSSSCPLCDGRNIRGYEKSKPLPHSEDVCIYNDFEVDFFDEKFEHLFEIKGLAPKTEGCKCSFKLLDGVWNNLRFFLKADKIMTIELTCPHNKKSEYTLAFTPMRDGTICIYIYKDRARTELLDTISFKYTGGYIPDFDLSEGVK